LFTLGEGNDTIKVIHVYGDPYSMGFAHGQLLKEELTKFTKELWEYIDDEARHGAPEWLQMLPKWMFDYLANFGLDALLDLTFEATRFFTGGYLLDEMKGLAAGSGVSYSTITRIHMIGYFILIFLLIIPESLLRVIAPCLVLGERLLKEDQPFNCVHL
jgi:isopenicillin-N N-acyltransferase-like protein